MDFDPRWFWFRLDKMKNPNDCPDCLKPLWAMICGVRLAPTDLIVCVACDFFALVCIEVVEPVTPLALDQASGLVS